MAHSDRTAGGGESGFTLLEVLVALVLGALALTMLFRTSALSVNATTHGDAATRAALHAQSIMAELGVSRPLVEGESDGRADPTTTWRLTAVERTAPTPLVRAFDIDLSVTSGGKTIALKSVKLVPSRISR